VKERSNPEEIMRRPLTPAAIATALVLLVAGTLAFRATWAGNALPLEAAEPIQTGTFVFENVAVLPMDGQGVLPGRTVLVVDGTIAAVGDAGSVQVPPGAIPIDGRGRFLMPGLAEMHAHVPPVPGGGDGWPDRDALEEILFLYLANGITTIRGMLGAPYQLELREAIRRGDIVGPNFYVGAPSLRNHDPAAAERLIRENAAAGYDFQKIHPGATRESWDRAVRAARELGFTMAGHVPSEVGLEHAIATGISTVDHLDGYVQAVASAEVRARLEGGENVPLDEVVASATPERIREVARLTAEAGVWQVPTLYLWENLTGAPDIEALLAKPEMRYVPAEQRRQWGSSAANRPAPPPAVAAAHNQLRLDILRAIHEAGGPILMGTDSPQLFNVPGFALHREIERMEAAGLPRLVILESGTREVARYVAEALGQEGNFGSVTVGNRADLVLLEASPLESLDNLQRLFGVMVRGRWLPGEELRERLARIEARYAGD
jgi:imidazolonepropionase-like amidohydrolase